MGVVRSMQRAAVSLLAGVATLVGSGLARGETPAPVGCLSSETRGPCQTPEAATILVPATGTETLAVANFGLLLPRANSSAWEYVCDDNFGIADSKGLRLSPSGEIFAPSNDGLYRSTDGCDWGLASGDIAKKFVFDVAFDRQNTNKVWAIGNVPRILWLSTDGGRTFAMKQAFPEAQRFARVVIPAQGGRIYLVGTGPAPMTFLATSIDDGATFSVKNIAAITPAPDESLNFVGIAPDDPLTLYFTVPSPTGDELWQTTDGGTTIARIFKLADSESFAGFTFGASAKTLFFAGQNDFAFGSDPVARLIVSRDAGKTWEAPIPSGAEGPRYRCLAWQNGKLLACTAGAMVGSDLLLGTSSDEGKTWSPLLRLDQLAGPKACVESRCAATEEWLCKYGRCPDAGTTPGTPESRDGGVMSEAGPKDGNGPCTGSDCNGKAGCSCHLGTHPANRSGMALLALLTASLLHLRRRRHR